MIREAAPKFQSKSNDWSGLHHESLFRSGLQSAERESLDLDQNFGAGSQIFLI